MKLSTSTGVFSSRITEKQGIKILKDAGFDAYDFSLDIVKIHDYWLNCDDYREKAIEFRKYADKIGIECNQCHAPFPSSRGNEDDEKIFESIVKSMEIASILGAKNIIVHPKQHLCYAEHAEELFNMNVEFYKRLLPFAKKFKIRIATENMWQYNDKCHSITDSTCSRAWEFCKYIDAIDSEWFVACLDIGHISLVNADIPAFIKALGKKRLKALHIHDTDYVRDLHTLPFTQKIDYHAVIKALAEIDYDGDFTYEADGFYAKFPEELFPQTAKFMCEVGRYLVLKFNEY